MHHRDKHLNLDQRFQINLRVLIHLKEYISLYNLLLVTSQPRNNCLRHYIKTEKFQMSRENRIVRRIVNKKKLFWEKEICVWKSETSLSLRATKKNFWYVRVVHKLHKKWVMEFDVEDTFPHVAFSGKMATTPWMWFQKLIYVF